VTAFDDEIRTLQARIAELESQEAGRERAERVQDALYRIAETASTAEDLQDFYRRIHAIVGELMYAENLYIALYDDERRMINFPYYVDTVDLDVPDPHVWEPFGIGNAAGTTAYLLRTGRPLLLSAADWRRMVARGEIELVGEEAASWVGVPLQSEGKTIGAIVVQSYLEDTVHTDADKELLEFVGHHIASALERTRLIDDTRQRNAELSLINDVQRGLAMNLDMQAMYDLVGDRLQEIFDAQVVDIAVLDEAAGIIRFTYTIEKGVRFHDEPMAVFGFRKRVLETREPLLFETITPEILAEYDQPSVISGEPAKSSIFVPLVVGGRATGVISLQNVDREHAFDDADLRLLTTLAGSLSIALENARLFEETRQRNAELALINDVQRGLAENLDMQTMYDLVGDRLQTIFDVQALNITVLDESDGLVRFPYIFERGERLTAEPQEPVGFRKHVLETREPFLVERITPELLAQYEQPPVLVGEPVKSSVWVPLVVAGRATGVISLQNLEKERAFSEADQRLLMTLAGSLSVALENARLFEETRQRNAELAVINDVQRGLAENLDMQAMYNLLGDRIQEIFDAQSIFVAVLDRADGLVHYPYSAERGVRQPDDPTPMSSGPTAHVFETREPVIINENALERFSELGGGFIQGEDAQSALYVPLVTAGEATGVVSLQNMDREHAFKDADVRLLTTLAGSLSVALENARLFEETRQRNAELALITDVQRGLAENLEMQAMYELVGDRIQEIFDAQTVDIGVVVPETGMIHFPYSITKGVRDPIDTNDPSGLTAHVLRTREPLLINEHAEERIAEIGGAQMVRAGGLSKSLLFVPLLVGGEVTGRISLQNLDREHSFSEADVRLLTTLAGSLSVALENARLFEETRQRNAELALINDVQRGLAENLEMQAMYDVVGDRIREIFEEAAHVVDIGILDPEDGLIHFPYTIERGARLTDEPFAPMGYRAHVLETLEPLRIDGSEKDDEYGQPHVVQGEESKSCVFVPLVVGRQATGVISIQNLDRERAFTGEDVRLLMTLAGSLSSALDNARLFEETKQRNAELALITDVQRTLAENLDIHAMYEMVGDRIQEIFDAQVVDIGVLDRETDLIHFPYSIERGVRYPDEPTGLGGLGGHVMRTREPIMLNEQVAERMAELVGDSAPIGSGEPAMSVLFVPLVVGGEATGRISLQNLDHEHAFGEGDLRLLTTIAGNLSVALENARLFEETKQRNAELALINDVQRGLAENLEMQAMYDLVGDRIRDIFDAQVIAIGIVNRESGLLENPYMLEKGERYTTEPMAIEGGPTRYVIDTGQTLVINDRFTERANELGPSPNWGEGGDPQSAVYVPLIVGGRAIGRITLQNMDRENAFSAADISLLTTLAGSLSVALDNARLFDETGQRAAELAIVNTVGQALAEQLDLNALIERLGDELVKVFEADLVYVALHDRETDMIDFAYYSEHGEKRPNPSLRFGEGLTSRIMQTREPLLLNQATAFEQTGVPVVGTPAKSYLGVPILSGSQAIGVISVQSIERAGRFGEADSRLLSTIAANVGAAIANARLYQETGRRASEMAALAELGKEVGGLLELDPIIGRIAQRALDLLDANSSAVFLESEERDRYLPVIAIGEDSDLVLAYAIHPGEGVIGSLAVEGRAEVVNELSADPRAIAVPGAEDEDERLMVAPLLARGRVTGMMAVWRKISAPLFTPDDLNFLVGLSQQAAIAIENARLFQSSKEAQEGYRKQKQYFESLVDISPVAVVTMDRDQIVSGWNPSAARLFGYSPEEAIGRTIDVLIVPQDLAQEGDEIVREATEGGRAHRMSRRRRKDAQPVEVEIDIVPLVVDGEHQGYYAIYHDITELQEARRTADAANESKSAFLATMSHEIRTPMNAIIGMSGLLAETDLDPEQREYATTIWRSGESLLTIINDILDFSKIEAGRMELELAPFDVRECIESVVDLIGPIAQRKGLEVTYGIEPGTPETAVSDASRLRQILLNLLNNAVKFTEEGEIAVHLSSSPGSDEGRIAFAASIRDTGIGIPADRIDELFQSFTQVDASTSRRFGGTGLGLAISRRLAELMGGTVWAKSSGVSGQGSTFHVTFEAGVTDMTPTALRRDGSFAGRRALVVDDNDTNLMLMTALLSAWGVETVTAKSGQEALAVVGDGRFDVAILDMLMPGMDGLELATTLRGRVSDLPTILASSVPRHDVAADPRWDAAGIGAVIVKPIKASGLHGALATVLGVHTGTAEADARETSALDAELASRHPLRILLTEDNVVNQRLALRLLEKLGYRADVAANGLEALEALERQPYDLVLMDIQMPEMDGVEATRRILDRWPDGERPWIVAMTAEVMHGDREGFLAAGMNDYVAKPIRPQELVAAIRRTPSRAGLEPSVDGDGARPAVDAAVLDRLAESMGGDDAFVAELIEQFVTDSPALVAAARKGLKAGDAEEVRRAAHTLKSNAATFGANELADRSRSLEMAARAGELDDGQASLDAVAEELERVHAALRSS
jgi:PAS domain S-box-containing protein